MARVMITGGFGTLGCWVLRELGRQHHDVTVFELDTPHNRVRAREFTELEVHWGDLRDPEQVAASIASQDLVLHLAFVLPPAAERDPEGAYAVNVGGTRHLIARCQAQARPPRLLFCSSAEVFGRTRHQPPPRRITDPRQITSVYTKHKIECEDLVQGSGLDHVIVRFGAIIDIALTNSHELMFEFPLDARFEAIHPADAALALANLVTCEAAWGRGALLLLGGGPRCQRTYGQFLAEMMQTVGVGPLPDEAFTRKDYPSDWLDTEESQCLLQYQHHSIEDIRREIAALMRWRKLLVPLMRPLVRRSILAKSPYLRAAARKR
jgi:nucleoside-diphosphate-sugar epimerase